MNREAIIVIDFTNDFVASDGKLSCGEPAQSIDERIATLVVMHHNAGNDVIFTNDLHYPGDANHPESKLFPEHNLINTSGREVYGKTGEALATLRKNNNGRLFEMDKTRYSAFHNTTLAGLLETRNIKKIHLVGVCTDICVLHTAVDAYNKGFETVIHKDAVASFNQAGHEWALEHFEKTLGFQVIEGLE